MNKQQSRCTECGAELPDSERIFIVCPACKTTLTNVDMGARKSVPFKPERSGFFRGARIRKP